MKRLVTVMTMLALSLVLAVQPAAAAAGFPDVPKTDRFHDEIQFLVDQDIISGYSNGKFQPKKNVTRGEAAIMIGRMLDLDDTKRNTTFKDVSKSHGASGYIASAADKGIITGLPDGTFRPDAPITRGDMAIILYRSFHLSTISHYDFSDVGTQMRAHEAIVHLAGGYITTGYPDGTFKPLGTVTREQFSAFLARGLNPEFKQRLAMKDSYAFDMTKRYVYTGTDGESINEYTYVEEEMYGKPLGYVWKNENLKDGKVTYFVQSEDKNQLMTGIPFSNYTTDLMYPLKLNQSWTTEPNYTDKITGLNKTVKTPYKTFEGAVEVTSNTGHKTYFVKGIGIVKAVDASGKTVNELKMIQ